MSIDQLVPMWRFTDRIVRSGLVMAWRLATSPTSTSPVFENATTDGVVRAPSELGMTTGSPASRTETTELVVPRSMPTALAMCDCLQIGVRDRDERRDRTRFENLECEGIKFVVRTAIPRGPPKFSRRPGTFGAQVGDSAG